MKLFITGISGLLGLNAALEARGRCEVSGCYDRHPVALAGAPARRVDVRAGGRLAEALQQASPDVVLHTVGMPNVDACELDPACAQELNVDAAGTVARLAHHLGTKLVHLSTDHIFDGTRPWSAESDPIGPLNLYAKTKAEAEALVLRECPDALVVRTNFYGWGTSVRSSFSDWILRGLAEGRPLTMFADVFFTPILVNDLVDAILDLVDRGATGVLHVAGSDRISKYVFALEAARVFGFGTTALRLSSVEEAGLRAARPRDMSLSSRKAEELLGRRLPGVADGLRRLLTLREAGWRDRLQAAIDAGRGERHGIQ